MNEKETEDFVEHDHSNMFFSFCVCVCPFKSCVDKISLSHPIT